MLIAAVFVLGIVPVVSSLDRGLWLSLGTGMMYAAVRLAIAGNSRALRINLLLIFTVIAVVLPLAIEDLGVRSSRPPAQQ